MCVRQRKNTHVKLEENKKNNFGEIALPLCKNKTDSVQEEWTDLFIHCPLEK